MQMDIPVAKAIEDVQARPDTRRLAIDQVGIKDIRHPLRILGRDGAVQHTVATSTLTVALPHHVKGTHMSRFVALLEEQDEPMTTGSFRAMLRNMTALLEADGGQITMRFPYFVRKTAPVSGVQSLLDYQVSLDGHIREGRTETRLEVVVPVTSLCPCSRSISDYGAHNQRSHVTVSAETGDGVYPEDLIALVEAEASCEIYGLLKRPDEKYVTERAYDNPKFVEDIVRDVAARLNAHPDILRYRVETENFESIHNHSAYAVIEGGTPGDHRP